MRPRHTTSTDGGSAETIGNTFRPVHPEHRSSCASKRPRHTVHPEHRRYCAYMRPRHTVHPEHKKPAEAGQKT